MARRKRASMREGPLADLFRSTVEPDDPPEAPSRPSPPAEDETSVLPEQAPEPPRASEPPPSAPEEEEEHALFDQAEEPPPASEPSAREEVRAYRAEDPPG